MSLSRVTWATVMEDQEHNNDTQSSVQTSASEYVLPANIKKVQMKKHTRNIQTADSGKYCKMQLLQLMLAGFSNSNI